MQSPSETGKDTTDCECQQASRRKFVKNASALAAGTLLLGGLAGCTDPEEPEMRIGTLTELNEQGTLSPKFNNKRVLATRLEGEIVIFSLICSHKKCTVEWAQQDKQFQCPCHDGIYDEYGYVVDGPPPTPLLRFRHEIRNENEIWVLNEYLPLES